MRCCGHVSRCQVQAQMNYRIRYDLAFIKDVPVKVWVILGIIVFGAIAFLAKRLETERAEKNMACRVSPVCQDGLARTISISEEMPIQSTTGQLYFKGNVCSKNCSGHMAGYRWAKARRISNRGRCIVNSESFTEGCLSYVAGTMGEGHDPR